MQRARAARLPWHRRAPIAACIVVVVATVALAARVYGQNPPPAAALSAPAALEQAVAVPQRPPPPASEESAQGAPAAEPVVAPEDGSQSVAEGGRDAILLNFEQADVREVIYTFAAALNINYWLDPRVQGQVTARSFGPIYVDDLYPVFLQILRSNGFAAVRQGDLYMIVPAEEGKTRAPAAGADDTKQSFVLEFAKVSHVSAEQIVTLMTPFVSPGGDVIAVPRNNLVVISDTAENAARLRELVSRFDTDTFENMTGKVYKIEHGVVEDVALELQKILETYHVAESGSRTQLIPLVRLNSLAVVGFDPSVFVAVEHWLSVLDVPGASGTQRQVFVYHVENSKAVDLADILNEVYQDLGGENEAPRSRSSALAERGVGLGGGLDQTGRRRTAGAEAARTRVVEQATQLLVGQPGEGLSGTQFEQEVRIVADETTNSLVVLATPRDYQAITSVLHALDIVPRQVLIEMLIAEITLGDDESFGVTHTFGNPTNTDGGGGSGGSGGNGGNGGTNGSLTGAVGTVASHALSGFLFGRPENDTGDSFKVTGTVGTDGVQNLTFRIFGDYSVTLDALARTSKLKILSRPHILTADNQEARILVGQEVPIITSRAETGVTGVGGQSQFLQNVQYRDTGVVINVTPQVNSEGLVNMLVSEEVSEVSSPARSVQQVDSPTFTTREAETTVVVQSGETVVIGGIISEADTDSTGGVPYLMNVPVLGQLFRGHSNSKRSTELIILITPYVVRDRQEARSVTAQFKARVDDVLRELDISEAGPDEGHTVILQKPVM